MPEITDERVACRICGQPLDEGSATCPACARNQMRTRRALAATVVGTVLLLALALLLLAVESLLR